MVAFGCFPLAWEVSASWLFCVGRQREDLFVFPYMQWLDYAVHWRRMAYMPTDLDGIVAHPLVWFVAGGVLSSFVFGALAWSMLRNMRPKETLFGDVKWAGQKEQAEAGIVRYRRS